ncbi:MAG TPA: hypothetical protein VN579_02480, partial [Bryobacteraceae bacterium]|nr:hypothetical protein [Bryobacteraceae bacterium]
YLGSMGYSYASSHDMIEQLSKAGVVEVYYVPNPYGDERPTAAIRRSAILPPPQAGSAQSDG